MSLSRTEITNLALREIGTFRLDNWTDDDPAADVARDVWDQARRMTLARHDWHFARRYASLPRSATAPEAQYEYFYTLPGDYIRLGLISEYETLDPHLTEYEMVEAGIATDAATVFIRYVYNHVTEGTWSPWFVNVFVADLASLMASPLKSETARERLEKLAQSRLASGRSLDSMQGPVRTPPSGSWVQAARGARWR